MDGTEHRAVAYTMTKLIWRYLLDLQYGLVLQEARPTQLFEATRQILIQTFANHLDRV